MLPRSLQAQLEEADRIVAVIEGTAPADTQPPVEAPAPQPQPQPAPTPQQPTAQPVEQPEETWRHKYQTLNGIFQAEKARLESAVHQYEGQAQTLLQQVTELRAELDAVRTQPKQSKRITDADRETFGAELVDLIERAQAPSVDATEVQRALRRIEELEGKLGQVAHTQQESAEEAFWRVLGEKVPNWAEVNETHEWKHWLLQVDPTFGVARQAGLDNAFKKRDAIRVAAIFNTYIETLPPPALTPQQELQRQVTPSRSRGATDITPQGNQGLIWTEASINAFLRDKRAGRLSNEQAAAYEEDLDRAAAEGRIR